MKNTFLYGAVIALVVIVASLGYSKYANHSAGTDTVAASQEMSDAIGTDEDAAENPDATAIAADAAVDATAEAKEAQQSDETAAVDATSDTTSAVAVPSAEGAVEGDTAATDPVDAADATAAAEDESLLAAPASLHMDVAEMMADRVLGQQDAPVTIVEFASYTCSHCAAFHNTVLPTVKEQLISTGKAKLILREFPLDKFALKASLLARCAPADKYYDLVEVIFRNQDRWVKSDDPIKALKQLGGLTGMDDAQMDSCLNNTEMENAVLKRVSDAQAKYKVNATPTFVFNEGAEQFSGSQSPEKFVEAVDKLSR